MRTDYFNMERIIEVCRKICYFFNINIIFLFFNLPALLFFMFVGGSQIRIYLPLFLCCMIPFAPALSAVFYAMNRLIRKIETTAYKDFIRGYRMDTWQKFKLSIIQLFAILVFWTNTQFFSVQLKIFPFVILFSVLFLYVIVMTPYLYLLSARYKMPNKDIIKSAAVLTISRPVCTLGLTASLGLILVFLEIAAGTAVLFMASIYGFLVVFISQNILRELENTMSQHITPN